MAALRFALTVIVELPEPPLIDVGLKLMETPLPAPEADKLIDELNPPLAAALRIEVPELPRETVSDEGDALRVKLAVVPVTDTVNVVVSTVVPEAPVTVIV